MTEIKLNEAALAAAEKALLETVPMYCDNNSASRIVRAYLTADPDRAARDAVVKAATMLVTANAKANRTMTPTAEMAYERAGITLDAAVAALPKEPPHE